MKNKKRRKRNLIKIRRRGPENPGGFGAPVSIGMGAYTIEGKIPTFKEYYDVLNNELNIPDPDDERSFSNTPSWGEWGAKVEELRARMIDAQKNWPIGLGQVGPSQDFYNMFKLFTPKNLWGLFTDFVEWTKGDKDNNRFSQIMREIEANDKK